MRILQIFSDGILAIAIQLIELQSTHHQVEIIDLSEENIDYDRIIDRIFSSDEVISW